MRHLTLARRVTLLIVGLSLLAASLNAADTQDLIDAAPEDLFVLRMVTQVAESSLTSELPILFQAYHPLTLEPVADLPVDVHVAWTTGEDGLDADIHDDVGRVEAETSHRLRTDASGQSWLRLPLPRSRVADLEIDIEAEATFRGLTRSVGDFIYISMAPEVLLSTDRRAYRPGQSVHLRGLWRQADGRPLADHGVQLSIRDDDGEPLETFFDRTSSSGVAAATWTVPENTPAGELSLAAEPDIFFQRPTFRIEVQEPPRIAVDVRVSQTIVAPSDAAWVDVEVRDSSGAPMSAAQVEIMPLGVERLYVDTSSLAQPSGVTEITSTDAQGQARLALDLSSYVDNYPDAQYLDLRLRCQVTPPGSADAIDTDFSLRLSLQDIHLYGSGTRGVDGLADDAFVLAQDSSGKPTSVALRVYRRDQAPDEPALGQVRTNALGVASLDGVPLPEDGEVLLLAVADDTLPSASQDDLLSVLGRAELSWPEADHLLLRIPRPLLRRGEALRGEVQVARPMRDVRIEVRRQDGRLLATRDFSHIDDAEAFSLPFEDAFEGPLLLTAFSTDPRSATETFLPYDESAVLYPSSEAPFRVSFTRDQATYRPGDTARLTFAVASADADSAPNTTLAIAVLDPLGALTQPLEASDSSTALTYDPPSLAGRTLEDLEAGGWTVDRLRQLPEAQRYAPEAQWVGRALLVNAFGSWPSEDFDNPIDSLRKALKAYFSKQKDDGPLGHALIRIQRSAPGQVVDDVSFLAELRRQGVDFEALLDPWHHPYRIEVALDESKRRFNIVSSGRDGLENTSDDVVAWSVNWSEPQVPHLPAPLTVKEGTCPSPGMGVLTGQATYGDQQEGIPGTLITARDVEQNCERVARADEHGSFRLPLPTGRYEVSAFLEGFERVTYSAIQIEDGRQTNLRFVLPIATFEEPIVFLCSLSGIRFVAGSTPELRRRQVGTTRRLADAASETLFWLADGRFDANGRLQVEVPLPNREGRWQVLALASDGRGRLSSVEGYLEVGKSGSSD